MAMPGYGRADRTSAWRHIDIVVPVIALAIAALGVVVIYSATRGPGLFEQPPNRFFLERQTLFVIVGVAVMATTAYVGHRVARQLIVPLYGALLLGLVAVMVIGVEVNGAQAWFRVAGFQVQPSEFGKIVLIVGLATLFGHGNEISSLRLMTGLAIAAVPVGLILLQPDLGTVLVYGAITAGMMITARTSTRQLLILFLALITGFVLVLNSSVLAEYQRDRLLVFIDDDAESDAAFNVEQSQIAIGNGGMTGQGLFNGTQTNSNLVPAQETDFIMTVVGEELGFVGSIALLGLFALLLARIWRIAQLAEDGYGLLICVGVLSMLLFQVFQSVGMATGMMPVTGIPLPLVSYGGSSALTTFMALGLVESVHMRRYV